MRPSPRPTAPRSIEPQKTRHEKCPAVSTQDLEPPHPRGGNADTWILKPSAKCRSLFHKYDIGKSCEIKHFRWLARNKLDRKVCHRHPLVIDRRILEGCRGETSRRTGHLGSEEWGRHEGTIFKVTETEGDKKARAQLDLESSPCKRLWFYMIALSYDLLFD